MSAFDNNLTSILCTVTSVTSEQNKTEQISAKFHQVCTTMSTFHLKIIFWNTLRSFQSVEIRHISIYQTNKHTCKIEYLEHIQSRAIYKYHWCLVSFSYPFLLQLSSILMQHFFTNTLNSWWTDIHILIIILYPTLENYNYPKLLKYSFAFVRWQFIKNSSIDLNMHLFFTIFEKY